MTLLVTRKACNGNDVDRISDLPRHLIDGILKRLPIKDVVQTSILSRKWRYMWASVPELEFDKKFFDYIGYGPSVDPGVSGVITEILMLHNGPLTLSIPPHFCGFKRLRKLHLIDIKFEPGALEGLISGCPLLEQITIASCSGFGSLNVSAPSLKILWTADERGIQPICFNETMNLICLTINLPGENIGEDGSSTLVNFFSCLPKIEELHLADGQIKVLSTSTIPETLPRLITSLKRLTLDGVNFNESRETLFIFCLIRSSPNLVELSIKSKRMAAGLVPGHVEELDCNSCCLSQLRIVKVEVETAFKRALDLIRFLLRNSPP